MWPALLVIAASALLKHQANEEAQDRRRAFQRSMEAFQRTKARESQAATEQLLAKQTPKEREGELQQVTADRTQSLRDTVGAAQAFDAPAIAGKPGSDYERAQEAQANTIAERTRRAIEQLAAMGAPGEQKLKHQLRFARASGDVDAANLASETVGSRYMTDISNVQPDPFKTMLSEVGMGVGTGMAAGGAGGAAGGMTPGAGDAEWGLMDPGSTPTFKQRLARGFSLWGR